MGRVSVQSTSISEIEYDRATMSLDVVFANGRTYRYFDVPQSVYEELLRADSKGRFLNYHIRDVYQFTRL